jgi:hypothetical protein
MWGTWFEWADPRMMSELVLLFLYLGYMALRAAIDDTAKADKASAVLALVGVVNVFIVKYSVEWWSSLHQGQTLLAEGGPKHERRHAGTAADQPARASRWCSAAGFSGASGPRCCSGSVGRGGFAN